MPITLACGCGRTLRVGDEHAGRRIKCPACGAVTDLAPPPPAPAPPAAPPPAPDPADADTVFEVTDAPPPREPAGPRKGPKNRRPAVDDPARYRPPPARWQGEFKTEAYIWMAAGGVIAVLFGYLVCYHARWLESLDKFDWGVKAAMFGAVLGLFAVGKGVYMLVYGSYPEND